MSAVPDASRVQDEVTLVESLPLTRSDPDVYALRLGNAVLGGGFYSTRLSRDLRKNAGLVYAIDSGFELEQSRGLFVTAYACDPINVSRVQAGVQRELEAMRKAAKFAPNNGDKIDREQQKRRFDSVAVFGDGINKIIRKRVDDEGGGVENPAAGPPREREQQAKPADERKRPEFPRLPPFPALIEKRGAVPKPPGAMKR